MPPKPAPAQPTPKQEPPRTERSNEEEEGENEHEDQHHEMSPQEQQLHEKRLKDAARFKKYLNKTGLPLVFQGIDQDNVFSYTAMRLRQIGNEIVQIVG